MKIINVKVALFLLFTSLASVSYGQWDLAPEPTLETPYNTIYTHLYYLQTDTYQPDIAAAVIPPGKTPEESERLSIQIKQVLDGKGLFVRLNELPQEANYQDSVTHKFYYTPFPAHLPEVYLERIDSKWYYSRETVALIPKLHRHVFPFGADILTRILPQKANMRVLGIALWQLMGIALVLIICWLIHLALSRLLRPIVRLLTGGERRWTFISKESAWKLARYLSLLVIAYTIRKMIPALQLPIKGSEFTNKSVDIFMTIILMMIALRIVYVLKQRGKELTLRTENRMDEQLLPVVSRILRIVITIVATVYILRTLNVNVAALIAGLSIGALALALAAQDTVKNLIGSVMIFVDRPFQVDDYIIGSGFEGTVTEIGFRSTRLLTVDTSIVSVPNGIIANMSLTNLGVRTFRIFNIMLSITYDTPPDRIEGFVEQLRALVIQHPNTNKENYHVYLREMGDSGIKIMFRCYLDVPSFADELVAKEKMYLDIIRIADRMGVEFAFPTTTVHLEGMPKPT